MGVMGENEPSLQHLTAALYAAGQQACAEVAARMRQPPPRRLIQAGSVVPMQDGREYLVDPHGAFRLVVPDQQTMILSRERGWKKLRKQLKRQRREMRAAHKA